MHSHNSQFSKKHHHKKRRQLVIGGVVIPTWPGYWTTIGGWGGFGGGELTTARDTDGTGSDAGTDAGVGGDGGAPANG